MDFDLLFGSSPEAQLALMNTMLQLEQALIADQTSPMASSVDTSSPPISPTQTPPHSHSVSPPAPHVSLSCTTADAGATGYYNDHQDMQYYYSMPPAAYGDAGTGIGAQQECHVSPGGTCAAPAPQRDAMREMIFHIAALQPVMNDDDGAAEAAARPAKKRRNVRTSKDPQSVAARLRRERISERIRVLQRLVPGGTKMDTASMLDEAIHYVKFLKSQVQSLELAAAHRAAAFGAAYPALLQHTPW